MCVCVCLCVCGCRTAVQFNDNREDFGVRNEEHDGGWRQENQSGGSAVELTAARAHLTQGPFSALTCSPALYLLQPRRTHLQYYPKENKSVSEPSQNVYLAFFTYDISKLKLILICNNWTRNSQISGPVYMTIKMGSLYDFWSSMWHVNQTRLTHLYFFPTTFCGVLCYVYQLIWFISWKMAGRQKIKTLRPWLHVCPDQADHLKKTGGLGLTSPDMYIFQKKRLMCMYMH